MQNICSIIYTFYYLLREERCRKRVSELKKQLVEVKRSKEKELSVSDSCRPLFLVEMFE